MSLLVRRLPQEIISAVEAERDPRRLRVRRYDVSVEEGKQLADEPEAPAPGMVKGPYAVQTYPVTVEGEYLVVDVVDAPRPSRRG